MNDGLSAADIVALTRGGGNGGFGGGNSNAWDNPFIYLVWLALLGNGGIFGRGGGFGSGSGSGGGDLSGIVTRADLYDGFAIQNLDSAIRAVQNGICDSTYALTNSITNGFHGVDNALCNLGYNMQKCCCDTQRSIDGVNYNMAQHFCDVNSTVHGVGRDIIDNQNANTRSILDFLVSEKLASKDAQIVQLTNQLSQVNQNAVIGARIDAAVAEVLRRTGNDCPTAAYLVQPPTPVNFPTNGCGTVQFSGFNGYGSGYGGGCGCGCA